MVVPLMGNSRRAVPYGAAGIGEFTVMRTSDNVTQPDSETFTTGFLAAAEAAPLEPLGRARRLPVFPRAVEAAFSRRLLWRGTSQRAPDLWRADREPDRPLNVCLAVGLITMLGRGE